MSHSVCLYFLQELHFVQKHAWRPFVSVLIPSQFSYEKDDSHSRVVNCTWRIRGLWVEVPNPTVLILKVFFQLVKVQRFQRVSRPAVNCLPSLQNLLNQVQREKQGVERRLIQTITIFIKEVTNGCVLSTCKALGCQLLLDQAGVALTQISAYIRHKNLAVRKIMEANCVQRAQNAGLSLNTSQTVHMRITITQGTRVLRKESARRLRTTFYFAESSDEPGGKGALKCVIRFSISFRLTRVSELLYANFSSTCIWRTHLLQS